MLGLSSATPGVSNLIDQAAAKYGINPTLLTAIAQQESGLNANAVSPAGAIGVMQLMPGTAAQYGANPYDAAQNVDAGAHYFADMLARYGGNTSLALAAYNAGPGNVDKYGGVPPFPETQNYVNSIMAMVGDLPASSLPDGSGTIGIDTGTANVGDAAGLFGLDTNQTALLFLALGGGILWWAFGR